MKSNVTSIIVQLALLSIFCISLETLRLIWSGHVAFIFLPFNLLLAWIPLGLALLAQKQSSKALLAGLLLCWLVFFPNAPYIITDLLHLKARAGMPFWFDTVLVFSFAFTGFIVGMVSALLMYTVLKHFVSPAVSKLIMGACMFLSGYGIYIGRFLRWNSWDVALNPAQIFIDTLTRVAHPYLYPRSYAVTVVTGMLLCIAFMMLQSLTQKEEA